MLSSFFRFNTSLLAILLSVCTSSGTWAKNASQEISFASFNLAFAATENEYKRALAACNLTNWCDPRQPISGITIGKLIAAEICTGTTQAAWGSENSAKNAPPCNAYSYAEEKGIVSLQNKNKFLGETIRQLATSTTNRPGVKIIAFQEVSSEQAIKEIVGLNFSRDYFFCDSGRHEGDIGRYEGVQNLAFMWHKSLGNVKCERFDKLSVSDGSKQLRPGLRLPLKINNQQISFLNVHLKASCASVFPDDKYPGRVLTDVKDPACKILLKQMPPLMEWLEETKKESPYFVILGDFNRKIDHEKSASELKIIGDDKLLGEKDKAKFPRFMWTFLSDKLEIQLLKLNELDKTTPSKDCEGFESLDHVIVSGELNNVQIKTPSSVKNPVLGEAIGNAYGKPVKASDHCPRVSTITLPN